MKRVAHLIIPAVLAGLFAAACSPPDQKTVASCKAAAVAKSHGHGMDASDIGELTEACMLNKGYVLKEDGPHCIDDIATATNSRCYYRDTVLGRLAARFTGD